MVEGEGQAQGRGHGAQGGDQKSELIMDKEGLVFASAAPTRAGTMNLQGATGWSHGPVQMVGLAGEKDGKEGGGIRAGGSYQPGLKVQAGSVVAPSMVPS